jgi:hypothetical protein
MDARRSRKDNIVLICIHFEPNRFEPVSLQTAYEHLVPVRRYPIREESRNPPRETLPDRQRRSA